MLPLELCWKKRSQPPGWLKFNGFGRGRSAARWMLCHRSCNWPSTLTMRCMAENLHSPAHPFLRSFLERFVTAPVPLLPRWFDVPVVMAAHKPRSRTTCYATDSSESRESRSSCSCLSQGRTEALLHPGITRSGFVFHVGRHNTLFL